MRALISLYHQTESFITPANLSDVIDEVFIYKRDTPTAIYGRFDQRRSELERELKERSALPRVGDGKNMQRPTYIGETGPTVQFSQNEELREVQVMYALYGIEDQGQPGYEVLEEEHERIQKHLKEDRESKVQTRD
jgi:hypothetical protein